MYVALEYILNRYMFNRVKKIALQQVSQHIRDYYLFEKKTVNKSRM